VRFSGFVFSPAKKKVFAIHVDFFMKFMHIYIKELSLSEVLHMKIKLTAVFQKVAEGYIGFVEELPGANTQGATLEEARAYLEEAVALVLDANRSLAEESLQGQNVIRETLQVSPA